MLARHHLGQAERARKMARLHSARCMMATIRFAIFALFKLNNLPIGQRLPDFASFAPWIGNEYQAKKLFCIIHFE
jgi:hypothetical protein